MRSVSTCYLAFCHTNDHRTHPEMSQKVITFLKGVEGLFPGGCVHKLPLSVNYLGTQWELFFLFKQLQSQYKSTINFFKWHQWRSTLAHRRLLFTLTISRQQIKPQNLLNWVSISTGFHKKLIQVQVATTEKSMQQHLKPAITVKLHHTNIVTTWLQAGREYSTSSLPNN